MEAALCCRAGLSLGFADEFYCAGGAGMRRFPASTAQGCDEAGLTSTNFSFDSDDGIFLLSLLK